MSARRVAANIEWSVGLLALGCASTANNTGDLRRDGGGDRITVEVIDGGSTSTLQLLRPITNTIVASRRPVLIWRAGSPTEAIVQICRDRACVMIQSELRTHANRVQPREPLPPGVHYWRVGTSTGTGTYWTPVWQFRTSAVSNDNAAMVSRDDAADYNGDGLADLAVLHDDGSVSVIWGDATQIHTTTYPARIFGPLTFFRRIGSADFNGDGFLDLVMTASTQPILPRTSFSIVTMNGSASGLDTGSIQVRLYRDDVLGSYPVPRRGGDLDEDGFDDILVEVSWPRLNSAMAGNGSLFVLWGSDHADGQATEIHAGEFASPYYGSLTASLDLDADGHRDIVTSEAPSSIITHGPMIGRSPNAWTMIDGGGAIRYLSGGIVCDLNRDTLGDATFDNGNEFGVVVAANLGTRSVQWIRLGEYWLWSATCVRTAGLQTDALMFQSEMDDTPAMMRGIEIVDGLVRETDYPLPPPISQRSSTELGYTAAGDFDGDQHADLAWSSGISTSERFRGHLFILAITAGQLRITNEFSFGSVTSIHL